MFIKKSDYEGLKTSMEEQIRLAISKIEFYQAGYDFLKPYIADGFKVEIRPCGENRVVFNLTKNNITGSGFLYPGYSHHIKSAILEARSDWQNKRDQVIEKVIQRELKRGDDDE